MNNINFNYSFKNIRKIAFNVAFGYSMGKFVACAVRGCINEVIKGLDNVTAPKEDKEVN